MIIQTLMCQFELSMASIEQAYPIRFGEYFARELAQLEPLQEDGLIEIDDDWLAVTSKGRLVIRNICMVFDRYLRLPRPGADLQQPMRFSRTI
jgi:oxygen-independent coproporphyrinogen-3 oxidase